MKRSYQKRIEPESVVGMKSSRPVQIALPMAEVVSQLEQGLGELVRKVGKLFIESMLEAEVEQLGGPRSRSNAERRAYRWGSEQGYCVVDSERVPIRRPRVREPGGAELPLRSYELFQRASLVEETVWSNVMRCLSMRNYKEVLQRFADAYGLEKSTIGEHFIEASRKKLQESMARSLAHLQICAMIVDGTIFKGQHLVAAIGIDAFGKKMGLVQGATENAKVVSGLLDQLAERGLDLISPVCICSTAAKRCVRQLRATPAMRLSSSAARCTKSATSAPICRKLIRIG